MANHRLSDLNAALFAQLDRMSRPDLTAEQIDAECKRTDAIVDLADQISENARLQLSAAKLYAEHGGQVLPHLPMIGKATEE